MNWKYSKIALRWLRAIAGSSIRSAIVLFVVAGSNALCDEANIPPQTIPADSVGSLDGPQLNERPTWSEALRAVLLTAIPDRYEDLKNWGRTKEIFDGFRVKQRGFNIRVDQRKRSVKHGMWHKYKIELIDPNKTLKLTIDEIRPLKPASFQFHIHLASKLRCRGDFEHWLLGIKGLNFTLVSEADVEAKAHCEVSIRTESNPKSLIPDLILEPKVQRVELFLRNIDVKRIGEMRGDIAEGTGDIARHDIENLLQDQESRVVKKINEAIEKKRSSLRFSASRLW